MAFSLGIISYTISTLVSTIGEVAEEILGSDDEFGIDSKVKDEVAQEIFEKVSKKTKAEELDGLMDNEQPARKDDEMVQCKEPVRNETYEDRTVTEYYLRYSYDLDDIPNTRLRSDFTGSAARLIRKSMEDSRQRQADRAREANRLAEEAAKSEQIRISRQKEALERQVVT
ncbi:MAG: hypothetical protein HKN33_02870 [Pyrinomonadaceae bacterium]|nr:hypothetical protein [Pyrinomonadaceae bacterium]